ncbi:DUF3108 domain-containing protein [Methylotenera sp.]|uniref:DUF3108 domain-containing protein n=1 Tax=Methylotenera sp. TaxID=2051956 RepID=UPI002487489B|nr:DUF3108 domain-containing protein [Methylotenera sp.]MDI1297551.1 DUF3108 domain-containing protein [Methylotenera sp.]
MLSQIRVFRAVSVLSLVFVFTTSSAFAAQQVNLPKRIQANYVVTKDGTPFANVREQYVVTGNTYKVESTTKGIGIYALLGLRKLTSAGKVTRKGLVPTHFELHQGSNPNKALFADFDWATNTLRMQGKGEPQAVPLAAGTQDLTSFAYQFMFLPRPFKNDITVTLTTGKKLNQYQYKVKPELEQLNVAGSQYKTVHLVPADLDKSQSETKELWLAAEQSFILVRFLMVDSDGAKLEQTLTELHVD